VSGQFDGICSRGAKRVLPRKKHRFVVAVSSNEEEAFVQHIVKKSVDIITKDAVERELHLL